MPNGWVYLVSEVLSRQILLTYTQIQHKKIKGYVHIKLTPFLILIEMAILTPFLILVEMANLTAFLPIINNLSYKQISNFLCP